MKTSSTVLFSTVLIAIVFLASPCRPETGNPEMPASKPSPEPALSDHAKALEIKAGKLGIVGVHFQSGTAEIDDRYLEQLHKIAEALNSEKMLSAKIMIRGHSDSDGSAERNLELSRRRARNAMALLTNRFGVDMRRLTYDGKGETAPIASNDTASGKSLNRRIEFIYLGEMDAGP